MESERATHKFICGGQPLVRGGGQLDRPCYEEEQREGLCGIESQCICAHEGCGLRFDSSVHHGQALGSTEICACDPLKEVQPDCPIHNKPLSLQEQVRSLELRTARISRPKPVCKDWLCQFHTDSQPHDFAMCKAAHHFCERCRHVSIEHTVTDEIAALRRENEMFNRSTGIALAEQSARLADARVRAIVATRLAATADVVAFLEAVCSEEADKQLGEMRKYPSGSLESRQHSAGVAVACNIKERVSALLSASKGSLPKC